MPNTTLDSLSRGIDREKNAAQPLYLQLKDVLAQAISNGILSVGDRLPTERDLQRTFQVSRATVRHALQLLELEGAIERQQGVGTVVTRPKIDPELSKLTSFSEDIEARGLRPGSRTLELSLRPPPVDALVPLGLSEGALVWYVRRLRLADEEPVGIHDLYIPPTLEFAPADLQSMPSYYTLLKQRHGLEPQKAVERFTAKNADAEEASILGIAEGSALLVIQRIAYTSDQQPVEYVDLVYRADRYEYRVQLTR